MKTLFSTKDVARFIGVNEKMVYSLISEKGLPATKVTGKWLFPKHLVEQWIEAHTINYPETADKLPNYEGLLIITGSNDPLLEKAITLFNQRFSEHVAVFGNLGSMGGLKALRRNLCHIAASHLLQESGREYNFEYAKAHFGTLPAIVNFCRREQGILVAKGNPKKIESIKDLAKPGVRMVNRPLGTGTRLLIDREFNKAKIQGEKITGYDTEVSRHLDIGTEILAGRADAGPAIRMVAKLLDLDFIPLRWERYDLLISKERFFDQGVQIFLGLLHDSEFRSMAGHNWGYDLAQAGKMVFPGGAIQGEDKG